MGIACLLSFWLASPQVAIASAAAFALSEGIDWFVYAALRDGGHTDLAQQAPSLCRWTRSWSWPVASALYRSVCSQHKSSARCWLRLSCMRFFVGLHQPSDAKHVSPAFISVNRLRSRKTFTVGDWIMDSGAFSTILRHGGYPLPVEEYAEQIKRWAGNGKLLTAVAQDYMCEPAMLKKTGLTISDHQRLTIERYDALLACDVGGVYIMPVLQGYTKADYLAHIDQYGERLKSGMWVGVGSVCKRNGASAIILDALGRSSATA
jgi:hypothetical protein